jgi:hypothetical protein
LAIPDIRMIKLAVFALALSACLAAAGCAPATTTHYDIGLTAVERPQDARARYGGTTITRVDTAGLGKYLFEDQLVSMAWIFTRDRLAFKLTNKTRYSLKVLWDEASYLDAGGQSHRVMHNGVKYIDRSLTEPPSVVIRGGSLEDVVLPIDYVYGNGADWIEGPFFPGRFDHAKQLTGKSVQILLPLEVEGVVNEYIFLFRINDVEAVPVATNAQQPDMPATVVSVDSVPAQQDSAEGTAPEPFSHPSGPPSVGEPRPAQQTPPALKDASEALDSADARPNNLLLSFEGFRRAIGDMQRKGLLLGYRESALERLEVDLTATAFGEPTLEYQLTRLFLAYGGTMNDDTQPTLVVQANGQQVGLYTRSGLRWDAASGRR